MRDEDRVRVVHMIGAARDALDFMTGRTRAHLDSDRMLLFAVVRAIEIVGEAASKVSEQTKSAHPQVPWQAIAGMRNRLVHAYFDIDRDIVWVTATKEVPALLQMLRTMDQANTPAPRPEA